MVGYQAQGLKTPKYYGLSVIRPNFGSPMGFGRKWLSECVWELFPISSINTQTQSNINQMGLGDQREKNESFQE